MCVVLNPFLQIIRYCRWQIALCCLIWEVRQWQRESNTWQYAFICYLYLDFLFSMTIVMPDTFWWRTVQGIATGIHDRVVMNSKSDSFVKSSNLVSMNYYILKDLFSFIYGGFSWLTFVNWNLINIVIPIFRGCQLSMNDLINVAFGI